MTNQLLAYHGDPAIKAKYLDRVRLHAMQDEIIHGKYWERGKGCAVGCTIHSSNHMAYQTELGIPVMLAHLEDRLFEGMQNGRSKAFPEQFLLAAKVGADLALVGWKFLYWLLTEELASRDDPRVSVQIKRCANVLVPLTKGEPCDKAEAAAAYAAAAAANANAAYAAYATAAAANANAAAYAAAYAAAAYADADANANAAYAAYAAANAANAANADANANAAYAAYAAANAANANATAADAAAAAANAYAAYAADADADAAAADARGACYGRMADKLLALMAECEGEPIRIAMGVAA